jgi:hypothetical protein
MTICNEDQHGLVPILILQFKALPLILLVILDTVDLGTRCSAFVLSRPVLVSFSFTYFLEMYMVVNPVKQHRPR